MQNIIVIFSTFFKCVFDRLAIHLMLTNKTHCVGTLIYLLLTLFKPHIFKFFSFKPNKKIENFKVNQLMTNYFHTVLDENRSKEQLK